MSGKLALVTGITGFIAGQVADAALAAGYRVRGTVRGSKAKTLNDANKVAGLEFVQIDDVATSDFSDALKGVDVILHVASPLPGKAEIEVTLESAVKGTLNVLEAAVKAGIEKAVVTSSFGAVLDPSLADAFKGKNFTETDWGKASLEDARAHASDPYYVYFTSKILAERAVWEFAERHPQLDIATILPGFVVGPWSKNYPLPSSASSIGSNEIIYALITGNDGVPIPPFVVDVRDVGKAHVLALNVPRKPLEQKRYLVNAGNYPWKQIVKFLKTERPDLRGITLPENITALPGDLSTLDTARVEKDLGLKWIGSEKTVLDTVDALLELQGSKSWK